jgi:hypothetical protein
MGITFAASSSSAEAPDIEAGLYDARFDGVDEGHIDNSQFGNGDVFFWHFTLFEDGKAIHLDGDPEPLTIDGTTSRSVNTKSKTTPRAVRWLKGLMTGEEFGAFEAGEGVDAEALDGRMCQVQVVIKESGWPKVDDVIAARRATRKAKG